MKHQMYGDLDEAKLIEGLTGEKGIYKRRGEKEPEVWTLDCIAIDTYVYSSIISLHYLSNQYYCIHRLQNLISYIIPYYTHT